MFNLQFLDFLNTYDFKLPYLGALFIFVYSLMLIFTLEKASRHGFPKKDIFNLVTIVAISGIIGARISYLYTFSQLNINLMNIVDLRDIFYKGNLSIIGGYLVALIIGCFYLKGFDVLRRAGMSWLKFFDTFLPIVPIGMIFGYLGLFFVTVNKGAISEITYPWVVMSGGNYVHPWALYISFGYLILLIIISILYNKFYNLNKSGYLTLTFVTGVNIIHFIADFWQTTDLKYGLPRIMGLTITQIVALLILLIISSTLVFLRNKSLNNQ
jgi:phosphatidylglycerol---prolipoprotein diacylglyceryl transferase